MADGYIPGRRNGLGPCEEQLAAMNVECPPAGGAGADGGAAGGAGNGGAAGADGTGGAACSGTGGGAGGAAAGGAAGGGAAGGAADCPPAPTEACVEIVAAIVVGPGEDGATPCNCCGK